MGFKGFWKMRLIPLFLSFKVQTTPGVGGNLAKDMFSWHVKRFSKISVEMLRLRKNSFLGTNTAPHIPDTLRSALVYLIKGLMHIYAHRTACKHK